MILDLSLTPETVLWVAIGGTFGRAFGKRLDQQIQQTKWFSERPPFLQYLIGSALDFLHHWWMGLLLFFYFPDTLAILGTEIRAPVVKWLGLGLFLDDLPDIPPRFRKWFEYLYKPFEEEKT